MHYGVTATIDLNMIAANYRLLQQRAPHSEMAGVVKANGYGLGADEIAKTLYACGCRTFYVALYTEALSLRKTIPDGVIAVLGGIPPGAKQEAHDQRITPVINDLAALARWRELATTLDIELDAILHIDTGMNRTGLDAFEFAKLKENNTTLTRGVNITHVMSHLACSDEPDHAMNQQQLSMFRDVSAAFPTAKKSFANSCGVFLGADYHFDQCRAGRALPGMDLPPVFATEMNQALRLTAPIISLRSIDRDGTVGYAATQHVKKGARLATLAAGYADGVLRSLSNRDQPPHSHFYLGSHKVPLVGRVSMDLIVVDVSAVPEQLAQPGALVDLAGPHQTVDQLATAAGTIGYELLTHIAARVRRVYVPLN